VTSGVCFSRGPGSAALPTRQRPHEAEGQARL